MKSRSAPRIPLELLGLAALAAVLLALSGACTRDPAPAPVELQWLTAAGDGSAPTTVNANVPVYQPPPMMDLQRLRAIIAGQQEPENPTFLIGTAWKGENIPPGEPRGLRFLGSILTVIQRDGRTTSMVVDYTMAHERCFDYPLCVVTLNANGALSVNYFHLAGEALQFAECMDFFPNPVPTDEELAATNARRIWSRNSVVCFVYNNGATYLADYGINGPTFVPVMSPPDPVTP